MIYSELLPSPRFAEIVRCYWTLESRAGTAPGEAERVLPDGNPEIVFNLADPYRRSTADGEERQPLTIVVGQMTRFINIRPTGRVRLFGVRFKPFGLRSLTGGGVADLADRIGSIFDVFGKSGLEIEERINAATGSEERRRFFELWLARQADGVKNCVPSIVGQAVRIIDAGAGLVRIGTLAGELSVNSRSLERGFRESVGISPKSYARIVRLQAAVRSICESPDLADAAYRSGYFDQAHFTHDFREFAGVTPGVFAREANLMAELFAGADVEFLQ